MATNEWKCYTCKPPYTGKEEEFRFEEYHRCPKCQGEDCFPYRVYRCLECKFEGDQDAFFGAETPADADPIHEEWKPKAHEKPEAKYDAPLCQSQRFEQIR